MSQFNFGSMGGNQLYANGQTSSGMGPAGLPGNFGFAAMPRRSSRNPSGAAVGPYGEEPGVGEGGRGRGGDIAPYDAPTQLAPVQRTGGSPGGSPRGPVNPATLTPYAAPVGNGGATGAAPLPRQMAALDLRRAGEFAGAVAGQPQTAATGQTTLPDGRVVNQYQETPAVTGARATTYAHYLNGKADVLDGGAGMNRSFAYDANTRANNAGVAGVDQAESVAGVNNANSGATRAGTDRFTQITPYTVSTARSGATDAAAKAAVTPQVYGNQLTGQRQTLERGAIENQALPGELSARTGAVNAGVGDMKSLHEENMRLRTQLDSMAKSMATKSKVDWMNDDGGGGGGGGYGGALTGGQHAARPNTIAPPAAASSQPKPLPRGQASQFLTMAGNNKEQAKALARMSGYDPDNLVN